MKTINKMQQMNKVIEMFTIFNSKVYSKLDVFDITYASHQEFESTMSELESYAKEIDGYFDLNLTYEVEYLKHYYKLLIGFDMDDIDEKYFEWYSKVCETAKDIYDTLLSI